MASFLTTKHEKQASYHRIILLLRVLMTLSKAWRLTACAALAAAGSSLAPAVAAFVLPVNPPISTGQNTFPKLNVGANIRRPSTATAMLLTEGAAAAAGAAATVSTEAAAAAVEATEKASTVLQAGFTGSSGSAAGLLSWAPVLSGIMDDMDPTKLGLFAFGGLGVAAAGFQTAVYWRMQYVVSERASLVWRFALVAVSRRLA